MCSRGPLGKAKGMGTKQDEALRMKLSAQYLLSPQSHLTPVGPITGLHAPLGSFSGTTPFWVGAQLAYSHLFWKLTTRWLCYSATMLAEEFGVPHTLQQAPMEGT